MLIGTVLHGIAIWPSRPTPHVTLSSARTFTAGKFIGIRVDCAESASQVQQTPGELAH